ncbi:MAG TPA: type I methionyl aminopeptidase [Armatimonadota bacterium]|nr:type I methionyl aminopeptidase [Armatimonadota bacterium]
MIILKSDIEIETMRAAGQIVAVALAEMAESIVPGKTTTADLDRLADEILARHEAIPSFKGYRGYPSATCLSINEEVVHGIPGVRVLEEGDIVGIDLGAVVDGYHGDSAITLPVGEVSREAQRLIRDTRGALFAGIRMARVGNRLGDVSHAIQVYAESRGYSVVRDLVGHGIGREMHEEPQVPNFGKAGRGPDLEEGMTLAIEPMLNAGRSQIETLADGWTIVTKDRRLSAHFEHTVAIRKDGPDILTLRPGETMP